MSVLSLWVLLRASSRKESALPESPCSLRKSSRGHDKRHRRPDIMGGINEEPYFVFIIFFLELVTFIP